MHKLILHIVKILKFANKILSRLQINYWLSRDVIETKHVNWITLLCPADIYSQ